MNRGAYVRKFWKNRFSPSGLILIIPIFVYLYWSHANSKEHSVQLLLEKLRGTEIELEEIRKTEAGKWLVKYSCQYEGCKMKFEDLVDLERKRIVPIEKKEASKR